MSEPPTALFILLMGSFWEIDCIEHVENEKGLLTVAEGLLLLTNNLENMEESPIKRNKWEKFLMSFKSAVLEHSFTEMDYSLANGLILGIFY
ncbi:hypothetical protein HME9304_00677 [Flagellimonas maritima]|uniref:Uncharacterized protein n=1 Tax=Flagellimonas maritima TaxID=1383885 RepID=A0A2Z4LPE9_9FLAO|nr:hypothetical protein HME9304_00677 [Allomuricauda aurantiaca]